MSKIRDDSMALTIVSVWYPQGGLNVIDYSGLGRQLGKAGTLWE